MTSKTEETEITPSKPSERMLRSKNSTIHSMLQEQLKKKRPHKAANPKPVDPLQMYKESFKMVNQKSLSKNSSLAEMDQPNRP